MTTFSKIPRQQRSEQTRNDLLDAAERLLKDRPWEQVSTVAIMTEAGVSNGAIYGRFKGKDELLIALYHRHDERLRERYELERRPRRPRKGETIETFLGREIDKLVSVMNESRWLLRAMGLLARQKPEIVTAEMRAERRGIFETIVSRFLPFENAIGGPGARRRIELTVFIVSTLLREAILHPGPHYDTLDMSEAELKRMVKRAALGHLGVDPKAKALSVASSK